MLDELRFYTFRTILVASPLHDAVHGRGAGMKQRWQLAAAALVRISGGGQLDGR